MIFLLLFLTIPLFFFLIQNCWSTRRRQIPPGPPGLPLIGNLHQLDKSPLFQQLSNLSKKYGPLMSLQLGFVPALVVSSAKMAKEVFKTHDAVFSGRPSLVGLQKLSYNGLDVGFSPYTAYTRELKKIFVLHLFNPKRVQSFRVIREEEVSRLIKRIDDISSGSDVINLSDMMISLTSTIICRVAFGKTYTDELFSRNKFYELLTESQAAALGFYMSDYFPYTGWIDKLTGQLARRDKTFIDFDNFVEKIISEHLDDKRDKSGPKNILDVLLEIHKDGLAPIKLTLNHIKAVLVVDIFIAGTDTSASALEWAMTELLKNPEALKRLQKEIRESNRNKGFVDEDDIQNLPYLEAVVKETLRLHPPVPLLPHKTTESCSINGYEIRPNTFVYVNAWAIGRDPESWENPEEFLPERFLDSCIDFRGKDMQLIPFGAGRRGCPGLNMGIMTVELALANLVYSFNWELPNGMNKEDIDSDVKPGVTVHKKNPLCLVARKYCSN